MMTPRLLAWTLLLLPAAGAEPAAGLIRSAPLDASRPYFIPTHPRVTTTIRFPAEIGPPDGALTVFTEDATRHPAEYLVSWQQGDAYVTLTPLREAAMANLNVPYRGRTYVVCLYCVPDPLQAVAAVNLVESSPAPAATGPGLAPPVAEAPVAITRSATPPRPDSVAATPARLLGFLDRLKLVHASPPGPALAGLVKAMNVQVAVSREELGPDPASGSPRDGVSSVIANGTNDAGLYQIILLRAVRDPRLNCIGFVCLVRNTSGQVLAFDVNSFGARAGAEYLVQRLSDATPILKPGEQAPAYFIVQPPRASPLVAGNLWKISVDLIDPRPNPGAAIAQAFAGRSGKP